MAEENKTSKQPLDIPKEEAEAMKRELRSMMVAEGYTIEKVAEELKQRYGSKESKNNLSNKLSRGTLRYIDVKRIANILGYKIVMIPPERE